jgi:hypothetical protein
MVSVLLPETPRPHQFQPELQFFHIYRNSSFSSFSQVHSQVTRSTWARLVLGMTVTDDARLKLEIAERQQANIGIGTAGKLACAEAAEIISSHHSAQIAVKTHLKLYLCAIVVPGAIWNAAALALRENVIMHCCSHTGGNGTFPDIEAMLLEMYQSQGSQHASSSAAHCPDVMMRSTGHLLVNLGKWVSGFF